MLFITCFSKQYNTAHITKFSNDDQANYVLKITAFVLQFFRYFQFYRANFGRVIKVFVCKFRLYKARVSAKKRKSFGDNHT